jgi:dCMP deaminase
VELSHLGTCDRKQVGAVIVKDGRCISWGYNGAPPGLPHCSENAHGWDNLPGVHGSTFHNHLIDERGCRNATHAEANALAYAARQGISVDGATLYVTLAPCLDCARLLIAAGIRAVDYDEEDRDRSGIELFSQLGGIIEE